MRLDRLHVEVTNVCNFKCEFCPDAIMERRRGHMDLGLLERILDEIADRQLAKIVTFHLMGEPLIYPHIFKAISMAVDRKLNLHLTTNGSAFALKPETIPALIESGLPKVTISLQTPDPVTFVIRGAPPRLTPEDYFDGIARYARANMRSDSPTRVHVKFLDTTPHPFLVPHKPLEVVAGKEQMQTQLREWVDRFFPDDRPEADGLDAQLRRHKPGRWQTISLHPKLALETFPLDSWGNVESDRIVPASFGYCNGASQQAGILYDGTVVPCCKDYEGLIPLGKVGEMSLSEILSDRPACGLRDGFNRFQVTNSVCKRCIGADSRGKALARQVASIAYFKAYSPLMRTLDSSWGEV